ncbi:protein FAM43A [Anthonomus grandis grandis]|uniref:protein FAM43A n=1 Tax=Anthonomus grandis grandis TaxID=2921223 RepID=UPI0021666FC3|nr:protein FAM43A [Anthonomus grandis grandis]
MECANNKVRTICEDKFMRKLTLPSICNEPRKSIQKEKKKSFKYMFSKIRLKKCVSATISKPFPTYHVAYLGNVITGWAKGEGCIEKPLTTLWRNYIKSSGPDVSMTLTVCGGGLKAVTKNHGLTEYWAHRLTTCEAPAGFPRLFCWVYRHEGRRLKHELRCHAALCSSSEMAAQIAKNLKEYLTQALIEYKKEKISRQNARLSLVNLVTDVQSLPQKKPASANAKFYNYRPPLECSKSAPKLSSIEEILGEEEIPNELLTKNQQMYRNILKTYERENVALSDKYSLIKTSTNITTEETPKAPKKSDNVDFKIGGQVHPSTLSNVEHQFSTPILSKGFIEQEQVSLVPVGEASLSDFSSLKVFKKKNGECGNNSVGYNFYNETVSQLDSIFQAHCSFEGVEEETVA